MRTAGISAYIREMALDDTFHYVKAESRKQKAIDVLSSEELVGQAANHLRLALKEILAISGDD